MADGAAPADDPFEGASSTRIHINNIPEKCNWSQIRKMFKGSTKIQSGKVDLKARDAWAECSDADAAKALALSIAVHAFEGGAWVVEFETPPPPFVPEHKRNKAAGQYGGPAQKTYGRFPDEPAYRTGSSRKDDDNDYSKRRRDDYHDRRRRQEQEDERRREWEYQIRRDEDQRRRDDRDADRRDRSRSRDTRGSRRSTKDDRRDRSRDRSRRR